MKSLHSRILLKLADTMTKPNHETDESSITQFVSKCPHVPDDIPSMESQEVYTHQHKTSFKLGSMNQRSQASISALIKYTMKAPQECQAHLLPRLLNYVRYLQVYDWDHYGVNEERKLVPILPDVITYQLFCGLLCIGHTLPDKHALIKSILWAYAQSIFREINSDNSDAEYIICFALPSMIGISRALQLSPYVFQTSQLNVVVEHVQGFTTQETLENIRTMITACLQSDDENTPSRRILDMYWRQGDPLSPNRIIYDVLVIFRNILARNIAYCSTTCTENGDGVVDHEDRRLSASMAMDMESLLKSNPHSTQCMEKTWAILMKRPGYICSSDGENSTASASIDVHCKGKKRVNSLQDDGSNTLTKRNLRSMYVTSMEYYQDLRNEIMATKKSGVSKPSQTHYMMVIMGTSLHVAALASVALHQLDDVLIGHIIECLFIVFEGSNPWVYVAALDSAVLLAINFQQLNTRMTQVICQFLATPSNIFDIETELDGKKISIRKFAVTRLAQCVQTLATTDVPQAAISILYSLLNEITHYDQSDDGVGAPLNPIMEKQKLLNITTLDTLNERQSRQICENVLSAIIGVAVYLKDETITTQALSMLLLEKKSFSVAATSSVLSSLVDLALITSSTVFEDILGIFSMYSREYLKTNDKTVWVTLVQTQTMLAERISVRPDLYQIYLTNILSLFLEHGSRIQHMESHGMPATRSSDMPLVTKLGTMLPILMELLEHDDFNPQDDPAFEGLVSLYRNFWIICVLFGFVTETMWIGEWHTALMVIAQKSPLLILESTKDYWETDLEYNSVLRGNRTSDQQLVLVQLRQNLVDILPTHSSEIKGFSCAQVVLLLSVYHIETRRSQMGNTSYILRYFMNESVSDGPLAPCLEGIMDCVVTKYINRSMTKALKQSLGENVNDHLKNLLPLCCHRLVKVHTLTCQVVHRIVSALPQVFAEKSLITLLLELVQLLWMSCVTEYKNEYKPLYYFTSKRANVTIELIDSFEYRRKACNKLCECAKTWLMLSLDCCPLEINGLLQDYLAEFNAFQDGMPMDAAHMGRTIALQVGKTASKDQVPVEFVPNIPGIQLDDSSNFANGFTTRIYYNGRVNGISQCDPGSIDELTHTSKQSEYIRSELELLLNDIKKKKTINHDRIHRALLSAAAYIISEKKVYPELIKNVVRIPVQAFTPQSLNSGTDVWNWLMIERPDLEKRLMIEILVMWTWAQRHRKGLFSPVLNFKNPFHQKMAYEPSDTDTMEASHKEAVLLFTPHETWLRFIISRFFSIRHKDKHLVHLSILLLRESFQNAHLMSTHSMSRLARFQLLDLGMQILHSVCLETLMECKLRALIYSTAYNWFGLPPCCRYGSWKSVALLERNIMVDLYRLVENDTPKLSHSVSSTSTLNSISNTTSSLHMISLDKTKDDVLRDHELSKKLLLLLLENEIYLCTVWCNPLNEYSPVHDLGNFSRPIEKSINTDDAWKKMIRFAWTKSPSMAVHLSSRFKLPIIKLELNKLIANNTLDVVGVPAALNILLGEGIQANAKLDLRYLKYWAPVSAITATNYFMPAYGNQPMILQYAMRSLEYYPVDVVFFYVPQLVQSIRHDEFGYVERYIMKAGQISQLFAHQIIWNMRANFFLDADKGCEKPDPMKPALERIIAKLVDSFDGEDREFYKREFKFFGDITAISGYLKEYIKYGQSEKKPMQKKRLDEELEKIKVDVGVYLPSNPDGHVVDISRTSGKPLQSHAKAPFMATFLIEKEQNKDLTTDTLLATSKKLPLTSDSTNSSDNSSGNEGEGETENSSISNSNVTDDDNSSGTNFRVWQGAIFKVGDDCRQDILALQLIAVFKSIFISVGLDLYVYPYRVVATGPGLGVIDVLPQSISRDQLGREKVNSIYDYFVAKYGSPNSIHFQRARMNFVQSLAAYSVVSYLLQFKDRHNGNIMLDDKGHIIHIDFGFIFDIAPGGGLLEKAPFKLTSEMIQLMGGNSDQQPFKQFSELVVKGYLASRPYAELIIQLVKPMLESGLPCFKGDTIRRLRTRFQIDKSDREAADFMIQRIKDSFENQRTVIYDYFQKITNGIPY
ncbi:unnamed protein product [Absidia cylindrospora]